MKIDGPSAAQVRRAALQAAAQQLAGGTPARQVRHELARRQLSGNEILDLWPEIQRASADILAQRRRRLLALATCSILLGSAMLATFAWTALVHQSLTLLLLFGLAPLSYGIHLLRLPPNRKPSLDPPRFFGRNL